MRNPAALLLRKNISAGQTAGYALSNIAGLAIIMAAIIFYNDISSAISPENNSLKDTSYMVISHRVSTFGGKNARFTTEELDSLSAQPWVADIAPLSSADFNVNAYARFGGQDFGTAMFFESVPKRFLDNVPESFSFNPGDREIPVILPRDYLSLYNFGFASSRGLPALSETMAGSMPLTVAISGNRGQATMRARIVGFTNRVNSILVPEEFLEYANSAFGSSGHQEPLYDRIIVKTNSPGNPEIEKYFDKRNIESSADNGESRRLSFFLEILTGVLISIGAVITLLSLFILLLSLSLLLQKNKREISGLLMLGYGTGRISSHYIRYLLVLNTLCLAVGATAAISASSLWREPLVRLGITCGSTTAAVSAGIIIMLLLSVRGSISVWRSVAKSF